MKRLFLMLVLSAFSCHHLTKKPNESDAAGTYYQVQKGDTLRTIAREYLTSEEEIANVNGVTELRVGQWLFLPENDAIGMRIRLVKRAAKKAVALTSAPKKAAQVQKKTPEPVAVAMPKKKDFLFPVQGGIVFKEFSLAKKQPYDGIGIRASLGSMVKSSNDGEVLYVGNDGTSYGLMVIIEHEEPFITVYTHLDKAVVKSKSQVKRGDIIGQVGRSGGARFPQLHFQLRVKERPVNPRPYLKMDRTGG